MTTLGRPGSIYGDDYDPFYMVNIKTKMLMVKSHSLLEAVVTDKHLDQDPKFFQAAGKKSLWQALRTMGGKVGIKDNDSTDQANADGQIAVAMSHSSAVQLFSQRSDRFTEVTLPATTDQPRSIAFARNGTLGVSFTESGRAGVYLLPRTGPLFVAAVDDPIGVTPYGSSSLIVGVASPDLVSSTGIVTQLVGPGDLANLDVATSAPAQLPNNKLSTVVGAGYLSYPVGAQSVTAAKTSSVLYLAAPNSCGTVTVKLPGSAATQPTEPAPSSCPWPFRLLTSDSTGGVWVVPAASRRTVELLKA